MLPPTRKTFQTPSGVTLSYLEWKPESATQPILLLHGMADHAGVWTDFAAGLNQCLDKSCHIIAPDLRGHGNSDKPDTGYGFADIIADLTALMADQHWSSAHILGHSWTGKMIAVWARQHPEQFRSLLLIDPAFINSLPS